MANEEGRYQETGSHESQERGNVSSVEMVPKIKPVNADWNWQSDDSW